MAAVSHALWSAWQQGWTYDEAFHLGWSERFLQTGISERTSQERFNSKTPIMVPGVLAREATRRAGVSRPEALRFAARAPGAVWLGLLLGLVYLAGRAWLGRTEAALATAAAALDPNLVAHASVATSDVPYAFAAVAALAASLWFWERGSVASALVAGAAIGLAFVAKVSAVLLLPGLALLPLLARRDARALPFRRLASRLPAVVAAAWIVACGAYLFRDIGRPLAALVPQSAPLAGLARAWPGLRLPLPEAMVTAFDASAAAERREYDVILLGRRHPTGVWYYFAVLWALKTPLLLLAAEVLGLGRTAADRVLRANALVRLMAVNLVITLAYFSLAFRPQVGYRYVLATIPMAALLAGGGLASLGPGRRWTVLAAVVGASALAENAAYAGNPLAFTNVAVQPKRLAYRLLADSNIDWGQNRERVAGWLAARDWTSARVDPLHLLPGRNVIGLNQLAGVGDFERHRWVREHLTPRGHLGHTSLWFDVDGDTYNRFLYDARRREADPRAAERCPPDLAYELRPSETETPFSLHRRPQPSETWVVCVVVRRDTDFGLRVLDGLVEAGTFEGGACRTTPVAEGQEWWWRLEPGTHALCLVAQPNRRPWLPFDLEARWLVRGWGVRLSVRPLIPPGGPPPPAATSPRSSSPPRPPAG